jgi:hypothetical protein
MASTLEQLTLAKMGKLAEQKVLSDKMNAMLRDRIIPSQLQNNKNLTVAVAVSKKPGFFDYYQAPDDVKEFEREKVLNKMAQQISKLHSEIVSISGEIDMAAAEQKKSTELKRTAEASGGEISSLRQWSEKYGRPANTQETQRDQYSTFKPASKIYGGTSHHRSFRSSASNMTRGRMTR